MNRAVRSLFSGSALTFSAIAAHLLAGGGIIHGDRLILISFLLICVSTIATSSELEGPKLAFIILISQFIGHFFLGTNTTSPTLMVLSHAVIALLAYLAIYSFEGLVCWISSKFSIASFKLSNVSAEEFSRIQILINKRFSILDLFCCFQYWTTSPPLVASIH
jgi:hypothetical protein